MPPPTVEQQIATAKQAMQQEMPAQMADTTVEPMGILGRSLGALKALAGGQTQAITSPFTGTISYDPAALAGQSQNDVSDMLAHELTHVGQIRNEPWYAPYLGLVGIGPHYDYGQDPNELEAFQTEANRAVAQGRAPNPMPTFSSPGFRSMGDISLPGLKKAAQ